MAAALNGVQRDQPELATRARWPRVVDVGGGAVDADGAHQRTAEPGREAGVVQEVGEGVAL